MHCWVVTSIDDKIWKTQSDTCVSKCYIVDLYGCHNLVIDSCVKFILICVRWEIVKSTVLNNLAGYKPTVCH